MAEKLVELALTEISPDSADYKNRLTLSGLPVKVGVLVPDALFEGDLLTPQGLGYLMTEIDLCLQRAYALRKPEYDAVIDGSYFKKHKEKGRG